MTGQQGIAQTGGREFFRLAGLFVQAVLAGRGILCALFLCAAVGSGGCLWLSRSEAVAVTQTSLPALEAALACEGAITEAVFHVSMFGATADMANYSAGRISLAALRSATARIGERVHALPGEVAFGQEVDALAELVRRLDLVAEKKRTVTETIAKQKARLRRTADTMAEALVTMQAVTASTSAQEGGDARDERARLLRLNGFVLAVEEVTGRALAAGVTRSPQELATARASFAEHWQNAREAVNAATALVHATGSRDESGDMETQVAVYKDTLRAMLLSLEESDRLNSERAEAVSRLTTAGRKLIGALRLQVEERVLFVEKMLTGGLLILAAFAVACAVVVGRGMRRGWGQACCEACKAVPPASGTAG